MKQPFSFPDHAFPPLATPVHGVPPAPLEKLAKIESGYHRLVRQVSGGRDLDSLTDPIDSGSETIESSLARRLSQNIHQQQDPSQLSKHQASESSPPKKINVNVMFKWAREAIDFSDSQAGMPPEIIAAARDIIVLVAQSTSGLTRFKGAALYILGVWYLFGLNGRQLNNNRALEYFYAAAQSEYPRALYRIGTEFEKAGDITNAVKYFTQGTAKNDSACLYRMAMCYLRGHLGVEIDVDRGRSLLNKASDTSDPDSSQASYMFGLVQLGELPSIAPPNPSLPASVGIQAIERAAWVGFGPALLRMGLAWQGGEKGYDSTVALRYFHIASRQQQYLRWKGDLSAGLGGHAEAEISKWMLCGSVDSFPPNDEYAFYFAKLASEQENGLAEFAVGYFYEVGVYVEQDIQAALIWYGIAASHESKDAADRLKELNLNRSNTITRQQHHRALTIRGRGSIKSSLRKKLDSKKQNQQEQLKLESKYPDLTGTPDFESRAPSPSRRVISKLFSRKSDVADPSEPLPIDDQITDDLSYQQQLQQQQQLEKMRQQHYNQLNYSNISTPPDLSNNQQHPRRARYSLPPNTYGSAHDHLVDDSFSASTNTNPSARYTRQSNTFNIQDIPQRSASPYVNGIPTTPVENEATLPHSHRGHVESNNPNRAFRASSPLKKVPVGESRRRSSPVSLGQANLPPVRSREKSRKSDIYQYHDYNNHSNDNYSPMNPAVRQTQTVSENINLERQHEFSLQTSLDTEKKTNHYGESVEDIEKVLSTIDLNQDINKSFFGNKAKDDNQKIAKKGGSERPVIEKRQDSDNTTKDNDNITDTTDKDDNSLQRKSWNILNGFFGLGSTGDNNHTVSKDPSKDEFDEGDAKEISVDKTQKGDYADFGKDSPEGDFQPKTQKEDKLTYTTGLSSQAHSRNSLPFTSNNHLNNFSAADFSHSLPPPRTTSSFHYDNSSNSSNSINSSPASSRRSSPMQNQYRRVTTPNIISSHRSSVGGDDSGNRNGSTEEIKSFVDNRRRANSNLSSFNHSTLDLETSTINSGSNLRSSTASIYTTVDSSLSSSLSSSVSRKPVKHHPRNPNVVVIDALPSQGKGPKTFEDMEVPVVKSKEDCIIM